MQTKHLTDEEQKTGGRQGERGQALVETALLVTVLILLLGFTLDIGRAYFSYLALKDAAGEGAYYGSVHPTWRLPADCANPNNIEFRVRNAAPTGTGGLVNLQAAAVTVNASGAGAGSVITVTATTTFQLLAPFTPIFVGGQTVPLTAVSSARVLSPATPCE